MRDMNLFPTSLLDFVVRGKPRPEEGQVLLTHALSSSSLHSFAETQRCESSDKPPNDAQLVYEATGLTHLRNQAFTCATASIELGFRHLELSSGYGEGDDIFLVIDGGRVADRTQVFNGDVGRMSSALLGGLEANRVLALPFDVPDLLEALQVLTKNNSRSSFTEPRKRGRFEARIISGIRPGDVLKIFLRQDASREEMDDAAKLFQLAAAERGLALDVSS
jgi:hypothetical protein